ncbi:hypothetical protein [Mucilaginibacter gotjawali]|uniref:Uncharacterized protein n=2 Tax=Mucilaginibacter gotjawali TaxID=1550579 RepID=A0A839SF93_9SPHI|nr:hypothetical protein [Mucilaginibacter gotjawali]MBB3055550.1 hypothetical protein [Mucilaginibacter gotjawali]BAU53170.1 hypothetical protein MgSA37_01337 [Mucilaginibacter gotjawali]
MNRYWPFKFIFCLIIYFLFSNSLKAQSVKPLAADSSLKTRAQNVYVEFAGPGLYFSANYDTRFSKRRDGIGGRIGVGYLDNYGSSFTSVPVQLNYLLGKKSKYFEAGLGATWVYFRAPGNVYSDIIYFNRTRGGNSTVLGTMTFGYRYQPVDGGFSFRASFNPLFNSSNFEPYVGISLGYTFK